MTIEKPTKLEKVTDSLVSQVGITAIAAYAATPLAALLPLLSGTLASGRHKKRIEKALIEINKTLQDHAEKLENLSDAQYKIINECVLTILQTTEEEKIQILKRTVQNNIENETIPAGYVTQISRILRDITPDEIKYLVKNQKYKKIIFDEETQINEELIVATGTDDAILVSGLIALGLVVPRSSTIDNLGCYTFSPLVKKIINTIGA